MKKKLVFTIIVVSISCILKAQNGWTQKMNFSSTAKMIGKVGVTADKISKVAPGLVGSTARVISKTAKSISSNAALTEDKKSKPKKTTIQ
jgi:hypothetical protein